MEFTIGEKQFRAGKLDAFKQLHVSRRIAPIIPPLIPIFVKVAKDGDLTKDIEGFAAVLEPFAEGLAGMSDADTEYVFGTCLSVVKRQVGTNWTPVWNAQANVCMFDDIDLGEMIQIVIKVVQDSLGNFINGLLTSQTE